MYEEFKRRDILIWCYAVTEKNKVECSSDRSKIQKRPRVADNGAGEKPKSKRDVCMKKIQEVEEIVEKLKTKHGNALNHERYNAWAHMLHTGRLEHIMLFFLPNILFRNCLYFYLLCSYDSRLFSYYCPIILINLLKKNQ